MFLRLNDTLDGEYGGAKYDAIMTTMILEEVVGWGLVGGDREGGFSACGEGWGFGTVTFLLARDGPGFFGMVGDYGEKVGFASAFAVTAWDARGSDTAGVEAGGGVLVLIR